MIQLGILEKFLDLAKQKLNPNVSMVDEIALLLNMSKEIKGFDFQVPPEKDPLLRGTPESEKKAIH